MNVFTEILQASYRLSAAREDAAWAQLQDARNRLAQQAGVPEVTSRKWMSIIEAEPGLPPKDPEKRAILNKIEGWAGAELTGKWLECARDFQVAAQRNHHAAMELSDHAGADTRWSAEASRELGQLRQKILANAARINPTVDVRLVREMTWEGEELRASGAPNGERQEIAGSYQLIPHLMTVSLAPRFDTEDTGWHEAWHSIEPVLTDREKKALQKAFPDNAHMTSNERVAVTFASWAKKRDRIEDPDIRTAFTKVSNFGKQIGSEILRPEYRHIEKIFENAYRGEMGQRMVEMFKDSRTQSDFLRKMKNSPKMAAKTETRHHPNMEVVDERPPYTPESEQARSQRYISERYENPPFSSAEKRWLQDPDAVRLRSVAIVGQEPGEEVTIDRKGTVFGKGTGSRSDPLRPLSNVEIEANKDRMAEQLANARYEIQRSMDRHTDLARDLGHQIAELGLNVRLVIPDKTESRYLFVQIPASPTPFKIRISSHPAPHGEYTDPRNGQRVWGEAGGFSEALKDRHPPSHININPDRGDRTDIAVQSVKALISSRGPLRLKHGEKNAMQPDMHPPSRPRRSARKKGISR